MNGNGNIEIKHRSKGSCMNIPALILDALGLVAFFIGCWATLILVWAL